MKHGQNNLGKGEQFQNLPQSYGNRQCCTSINNNMYVNRPKTSEINPRIYGQLTFYKNVKAIQWGKEQCFQQMVMEQMDVYVQKNGDGLSPESIYKN